MKLMVATNEKQGERKNDFSFTNNYEFVKFGFECDGESVDGVCGCKRSFCGFETGKGTTTAKVEERDITREVYKGLVSKALKREGWLDCYSEKEIEEEVEDLIRVASGFKVGSVVEKRGNKIQLRV